MDTALVFNPPLMPPPMQPMDGPARIGTLLGTLLRDHAIFRYVYNTRRRIAPDVYRSSHPLPSQLREAAEIGVRTVINLRRPDPTIPSNRLSWEACARYGLRQVHFAFNSRTAPRREEILGFEQLLHQVEYPILMHCKAGADRAGIASALFLLLRGGAPVDVAARQLSFWRFGHVRQAKTGVLDHFLETYRQHQVGHGTPFLEWVKHHYDRDAVAASFRARWWANRLTDWVLRRE